MNNVMILIIIAAISGGSIPPFAKVALEVFQPFTLVLIRFFFATLVLLPFVYRKNELSLKAFQNLFWVAIIGSLNPILLFIALQFTKSAVSPLIYASLPLMTVLYMAKWRNHSVSKEKLKGVLIGFIGVAMIILLPFFEAKNIDFMGFAGNILIFGAAIAFFIYGLLLKEKQQKLHITPIALTFYFSLATFLLVIPFSIYEISQKNLIFSNIQVSHFLASLEIGVIGTSLFYLVYQQSLKLSSALTAALFTYLQPVATVIFAVMLLGEKITLPFIIGGILAVAGAQIASKK